VVVQEEEVKAGSEEWRVAMKSAVEGSDWSAVIAEQTSATIDPTHQGSTNDAPPPTLPPSAAAAVALAEAAAAERAAERAAKSAARTAAASTAAAAAADETVISPFTTEAAQRCVGVTGCCTHAVRAVAARRAGEGGRSAHDACCPNASCWAGVGPCCLSSCDGWPALVTLAAPAFVIGGLPL
jgi:hypothetical protein